jgi:hypothetical protein
MAPTSDLNTDFERHSRSGRGGLMAEFWGLLRENKKWWLLPILIVLVGMGGLILLSGTAVAPFIYTLF